MQITIRDPGSALTHFIAMILAMFGAMPLLIKVGNSMNAVNTFAICIFIIGMVLLYAASTLYHSLNLTGEKLKIFKKIDHMMIFILIAGTYTPICVITLGNPTGYILLGVVWGIALAGIFFKLCWVTCPKWVSSVLYIGMGWACVSVFGTLWTALPTPAFFWLLIGGIIYTMGGSLCHMLCMYYIV